MKKLPVVLLGVSLPLGSAAAAPGPLGPWGPVGPPRLLHADRPYDVRHYRLLMRLDPKTGAYQTSAAITFQVSAPMSVLELDAVGLHPTGAWLLSRPGDPEGGQATALPVVVREDQKDEAQGRMLVTLPLRLQPGTEASVEIGVNATARRGAAGLTRLPDPDLPRRPPLFLTPLAPLGARRLFPCHDDPADKATFDVTVETDGKLQVYASGRRVEDTPLPGGRHRVRYAMTRPLPPHLLGLAVGAFAEDSIDDGTVPLDAYLGRGRAAFALEAAREALHGFQRFLDVPYPFERYGLLETPSSGPPGPWALAAPHGGAAGASLGLLPRALLLPPSPDAALSRLRTTAAVGRAVAQQWFGGLVTMRSWDELWLSEAPAAYLAGRLLRERYGEGAMDVMALAELEEGYLRTEAGPRSHPLVHRDALSPEDAFDAIADRKGAQVLRMLEELLGEERLAAGLGRFLREHAYQTASSADLLAALAAAQQAGPPPRRVSGAAVETPVAEFARSWLERRGHPVLTVSYRYDAAQGKTLLTARQRSSQPGDDTRWHVRLPVGLRRRSPRFDVEAVLVLGPDKAEATLGVPTPEPPDWVAWNRGGLALVTIEAPGTTEGTWALAAQSDPDPATRYQALMKLVRPSLSELSKGAAEALGRALAMDPSAQLRYQLGRRLARLPGALPEPLARAAIAAAQGPVGVDFEDPLTVLLSRAGAIELCGRAPGAEAERLLIELAEGPQTPIDLLGPAAAGLARRGDDVALSALEQAARAQAARGPAYLGRVLGAYGALSSPRHLREVVRVVREHAQEAAVVSEVLRGLLHNEELRRGPELPQAVADLVLGSPQLDEEQQARALQAVEGLRSKEAREVLEAVRQRARAARVRALAHLFLSRTFG